MKTNGSFLNQAWRPMRKKKKKNKIEGKEILKGPENFRDAYTARLQRDFHFKNQTPI